MRADAHLLTEAGRIAEAVAEAVRRSGATPVNLRKILRHAKLAKGTNVSGPQNDWPASTPAAELDYEANLRAQQEAITNAIRANGGFPLPANHPLVQARNDMRFQSAFTPVDDNTDGRSDAAAAIRRVHKSGGRSELARHFASRMKKTIEAATKPRYTHLHLGDPTGTGAGAILRKGDPHMTSLEAIKKAVTGPRRQLDKATGLPQDAGTWDDERSDDGADLAHDSAVGDRGSGLYSPRANPTQLGPRHSASITSRTAGPQDSDIGPADPDPARAGAVNASEDATVKALKAIYAAGPTGIWGYR